MEDVVYQYSGHFQLTRFMFVSRTLYPFPQLYRSTALHPTPILSTTLALRSSHYRWAEAFTESDVRYVPWLRSYRLSKLSTRVFAYGIRGLSLISYEASRVHVRGGGPESHISLLRMNPSCCKRKG